MQVGNSLRNNKSEEASRQAQILRVAKFMLGTSLVSIPIYFYLALFHYPSWQLFSFACAVAAYSGVVYYGIKLIQKGQSGRGVWYIIYGLSFFGPFSSGIFADVSTLSLGLFAMILFIAVEGLPQNDVPRAIMVGIGSGIGSLLMDMIGFSYRLAIPEIKPILVWSVILIVSVFATYLVRHFRTYPLRVKMMVAFLFVTLLPINAVAYLNSRIATSSLVSQAGENLEKIADTTATIVGERLARQLDSVESVARNEIVQREVRESNLQYSGIPTMVIQAQLEDLDQQWVNANNSDPWLNAHLTNTLAEKLLEFQALFSGHAEVFVTDKMGGLVAATNRTSDYYQADEVWWQAAYNQGQGATFIGQPAFDYSSGTLAVNMAMPIFASDSSEIIGIIRTTYDVQALAEVLLIAQVGETGEAEIYLPDQQKFRITSAGNRFEVVFEEATIDRNLLRPRSIRRTADVAQLVYDNRPSLVSQASIDAINGEDAVAELDWWIVIHQDQSEALSAAVAERRSTSFLALLIAGLAAIVAIAVSEFLVNPISQLTNVAKRVAEGDLTAQVETKSGDEIDNLGMAFNTMTQQLHHTIASLETRNLQIETVVKLGQRLAGVLDFNQLMQDVVTLTKETFGYYHTHIYMLDEAGQNLVIAESYGEAGADMKARGHSIPLTAAKSLVARAARENSVVIVQDVREEEGWLANPLLPNTRSEMAVPVQLGDEIVGVLDVQSNIIGGLNENDKATLQALSNLIATAVQNARLFAETHDLLEQAERIQALYSEKSWEQFLKGQEAKEFEHRLPDLSPLSEVNTPEAGEALRHRRTVKLDLHSVSSQQADKAADTAERPRQETVGAVATPLQLRNSVIGVLGIRDEDNPDRQWTDDEIALIEAVSEQMSLAIENARLFADTKRAAWRDQIISESTAKVWSAAEIEAVMQTAIAQLGDKLKASEVVIRLGTEDKLGF